MNSGACGYGATAGLHLEQGTLSQNSNEGVYKGRGLSYNLDW